MEGHSPFPDPKQPDRVAQPIIEMVEEDIAKAPPQNHPESHISREVFHLGALDHRMRKTSPAQSQKPGAGKAEQVHQTIPVNIQRTIGLAGKLKRANTHGHRVNFGVFHKPCLSQSVNGGTNQCGGILPLLDDEHSAFARPALNRWSWRGESGALRRDHAGCRRRAGGSDRRPARSSPQKATLAPAPG